MLPLHLHFGGYFPDLKLAGNRCTLEDDWGGQCHFGCDSTTSPLTFSWAQVSGK